jgi:Ni,Fe-hydrogenase I cytochrome b subunit
MEEKDFRDLKNRVEETHQMVLKLYKFEKNRRFWRALKLIFIIVIIVGAYFAILPVFKKVLDTYNSFSNGVTQIENLKLPWSSNDQ